MSTHAGERRTNTTGLNLDMDEVMTHITQGGAQ